MAARAEPLKVCGPVEDSNSCSVGFYDTVGGHCQGRGVNTLGSCRDRGDGSGGSAEAQACARPCIRDVTLVAGGRTEESCS